jgi:hypothetical protein
MTFQMTWYHSDQRANPARKMRALRMADSVVIGREDGADIVIKDSAVSRLHAEVSVGGDGVRVRDRGSANGVFVDGRQVQEATWLPGQVVQIGPYQFELAPQAIDSPQLDARPPQPQQPPLPARPAMQPNLGPAAFQFPPLDTRLGQPAASTGRIELGALFERARNNDRQAVRSLFQGFLGKTEQIVDCGYLGALGFVFPEYSFWCVTNTRVCGLLINSAGWMNFNFGFTRSLNRGLFVQPSLIALWIWIISWCVFALMASVFMGMVGEVMVREWLGFILGRLAGIVAFLCTAAAGVVLVPRVIRAYYRWVKAGCIFWTRELVPIVIPADRNSLRDAQRFVGVFTDQKNMIGD